MAAPIAEKPPRKSSYKPVWQKKQEQKQLEAALMARILVAKENGCPADQIQNFLTANFFPHPKQYEFCAKCRECDRPDGPMSIMSGGGRGSAKSTAAFAQIFLDDGKRCPGLVALILRRVGTANKEQIQTMRQKLLMAVPHVYKEQAGIIIREDTNATFHLGHFKDEKDIDRYLGLQYDVILIEEANQLSQSKIKNIISCLRTDKPTWRPRCYLTTNPGGISHASNKIIYVDPWKSGVETHTRYLHSTVDDNPSVNPEYKTFLQSLVGWQKMAWLDGSWEFAAGQFFINWREHGEICHVMETMDERKIVRWFAGLDYGWNHYTTFYLAGEDINGFLYILDRHRGRLMTIAQHAPEIHRLLTKHQIQANLLEFIAAGKDCFSKRPDGTTISDEYDKHGLTLSPAEIDRVNRFSKMVDLLGDIENGIMPRMYVHARCTELISQIPAMQHDPDKPEDILKIDINSEDGSGGDDDFDCTTFIVSTRPVHAVRVALPVSIGGYQSLTDSFGGYKRIGG